MRSELLRVIDPGQVGCDAWQTVPATYQETIYLGLTTSHLVRLPDGSEVVVREMSDEPGSNVQRDLPVLFALTQRLDG